MKFNLFSWLLIFFLFQTSLSFAQDDNTKLNDSLTIRDPPVKIKKKKQKDIRLRDPQRAALYSAVLPGLGQAYNKKYWKIPLIYGGFFALGYYINWNNDNYNLYRGALFAIIDGNSNTPNPFPGFTEDQLRQITDQFRRNRDVLIILTGVLYALNIIDAHVDAHLKEFDINEDLALSIRPASINSNYYSAAGISFALKIK